MIETEKRDYCRTPNRTRTSPNHDPRRMIQAFVTWNGRSEKVGTLGTLRILVTDGSTGSGQPRKIHQQSAVNYLLIRQIGSNLRKHSPNLIAFVRLSNAKQDRDPSSSHGRKSLIPSVLAC